MAGVAGNSMAFLFMYVNLSMIVFVLVCMCVEVKIKGLIKAYYGRHKELPEFSRDLLYEN